MTTYEQELLDVYESQINFMHKVVRQMKSLWSNSVFLYEYDDMFSVLKVEFFARYKNYEDEKGSFLSYVNNSYHDSIRREVSRVKNGLTYPYNTVIDRLPEIYKTLEELDITIDELLEKKELYNELFGERERFMSYDTCLLFFKNRLKTTDDEFEIEGRIFPRLEFIEVEENTKREVQVDEIAIRMAEISHLPKFLKYWIIQLYKGYEIKDILNKLGITNEAFYRNYVRNYLREFFSDREIDYALLHDEIEHRVRKTRYKITDEEFWNEINGVVEKEITLLT